jgi:hypothetical protein
MQLTTQEQRCVDEACRFLGETLGGMWSVSQVLDQAIPNEPAPECIVSNGRCAAAVEVKQLFGPNYEAYWLSLMTKLAPQVPGHFQLWPPYDRTLPWERDFIRLIRKAIAESAPTIPLGAEGAIKVPRNAHVARSSSSGSYVHCIHNHPSLVRLSGQVPGVFLLADDGPEHEFASDEAVERFVEAVKQGCLDYEAKAPLVVEWFDEWPLWRYEADYSKVEVTIPTKGFAVQPAVDDSVWLMVGAASRKFERDWAALNVVVLETRFHFADRHRVLDSISYWTAEDFGKIDLILFVEDETTSPLWHSQRFAKLAGGNSA